MVRVGITLTPLDGINVDLLFGNTFAKEAAAKRIQRRFMNNAQGETFA